MSKTDNKGKAKGKQDPQPTAEQIIFTGSLVDNLPTLNWTINHVAPLFYTFLKRSINGADAVIIPPPVTGCTGGGTDAKDVGAYTDEYKDIINSGNDNLHVPVNGDEVTYQIAVTEGNETENISYVSTFITFVIGT